MLFQLRTACVISKLYYNSQYNAKLMQNLKKVGRLGRAKTCPMDQPKRQGFLGQFYFQDDEGFSRWHLDLRYLESWLRNHHKLNNTAEEKSSLKVSCWSVYDPCSCLSQLVPLSSKTNSTKHFESRKLLNIDNNAFFMSSWRKGPEV